MEVIQKHKNHLLDREEVIVVVKEEITPSKNSLQEKIASHFKSSKENVVIEKIEGKFGKKEFTVYSKIYDNNKSREKFEVISKKQRDAIKKAAEETAKKAQEEAAASSETAEGAS
ncbi:MAG: hypothetical protein AABX03_00130 [Nanoarchaeota archaeon]